MKIICWNKLFLLRVALLVSGHTGGCAGAKSANVAHERTFIGVLESGVRFQGLLVHSTVVARLALKPLLLCITMFPPLMTL